MNSAHAEGGDAEAASEVQRPAHTTHIRFTGRCMLKEDDAQLSRGEAGVGCTVERASRAAASASGGVIRSGHRAR
jgi:hypothetical protein